MALRWSEWLVALAVVVGSLELLAVRPAWSEQGTWRWSILRRELPGFGAILGSGPFTLLLVSRAAAAGWLLVTPSLWALAWVWGASLLANLRFRGTWNGGSDHMLMVVLSGALVARAGAGHEVLVTAGVAWIGVQGVLSYAIAGIAKLRSAAWRDGTALPVLLAIPAYGVPVRARRVFDNPRLARVAAWVVLAFECAFPLVLLHPVVAVMGCALAAAFHLGNAWVFGLNRFLLTWAATWPGIVAIATIRAG